VAVLKTLRPVRHPRDVCRALELARAHGIGCPTLLASAAAPSGWLALFDHVEGHVPDPLSTAWPKAWSAAVSLLTQLSRIREHVASWDLESEWLDNVAPAAAEDEAACDLLCRLRERAPDGVPCFAHGDFAPQNFVLGGPAGLTLIDWEDCGYSRPGFDAGWLLSLNRIGAGPRCEQTVLHRRLIDETGVVDTNLKWFEGLGLLRMHARAYAWTDRPLERAFILEAVRLAISSHRM
jgi:aminoglycoside phosphotransferase (APT) family kinase protein